MLSFYLWCINFNRYINVGGHDVKNPVSKQNQDELLAVDKPKCQHRSGNIFKVD